MAGPAEMVAPVEDPGWFRGRGKTDGTDSYHGKVHREGGLGEDSRIKEGLTADELTSSSVY